MNDYFEVSVLVYDLSGGMAKIFSPFILGEYMEAVWHTSIMVYGHQFYFNLGIYRQEPQTTPYGFPLKEIRYGYTQINKELFQQYLEFIQNDFSPTTYDFFQQNCNHFTQEALNFLVNDSLPQNIIQQPVRFLNTPMGNMLEPLIKSYFQNPADQDQKGKNDFSTTNLQYAKTLDSVPSSLKEYQQKEKLVDPQEQQNSHHRKNQSKNEGDDPFQKVMNNINNINEIVNSNSSFEFLSPRDEKSSFFNNQISNQELLIQLINKKYTFFVFYYDNKGLQIKQEFEKLIQLEGDEQQYKMIFLDTGQIKDLNYQAKIFYNPLLEFYCQGELKQSWEKTSFLNQKGIGKILQNEIECSNN